LAGRARVRPALRRLAAVGMAASRVIAAPVLARQRSTLEIHAIDVGQGDALALRTPRGRWILVDAGPRGMGYDAGRSRVVPYLLRQGAGRLDLLVITHPDADHVGGAAAVLDALGAGAVLDPGLAAGKDVYLEALREAAEGGTRWLAGVAGDELEIDGVRLRVLAPAPGEVAGGAESNAVSVVFRAEFGAFAALFTGDADVAVERRLLRDGPELLRAQLLKVGHHGSATSTSEELLVAMGTPLAVISVGRRNRYGHPHPAVLERLERRGVRVLRTDRNGAITIRAARSGAVRVETTR
ncbi:MAG TPA: ComEC/Rec2 family competence protein, partial [Longimicrobiales bacterium]|nr:ComEC/Rec2 family competence protein [Longimicrobiales bacterium]